MFFAFRMEFAVTEIIFKNLNTEVRNTNGNANNSTNPIFGGNFEVGPP